MYQQMNNYRRRGDIYPRSLDSDIVPDTCVPLYQLDILQRVFCF